MIIQRERRSTGDCRHDGGGVYDRRRYVKCYFKTIMITRHGETGLHITNHSSFIFEASNTNNFQLSCDCVFTRIFVLVW